MPLETTVSFQCPNCGLLNPPGAQRCDCGFRFLPSSQAAILAETSHEPHFPPEQEHEFLAARGLSSPGREFWDWAHIFAGFLATVGGLGAAIWFTYLGLTVSRRWAVLLVFLLLRFGIAPLFVVSASIIYFHYHAAGLWLPISSVVLGGMTLYDKLVREKRDRHAL